MKKIIFKEDENNTVIIVGTGQNGTLKIFKQSPHKKMRAIALRGDENEKTRN